MVNETKLNSHSDNNLSLISDLKKLIDESKTKVALSINEEMSNLYWKVGKRINDEILNNKRAEYGKQIVATLSRQLEIVFTTTNTFARETT